MFEDGIVEIIQQIKPEYEISKEILDELEYIIKYLIVRIAGKVGILLSCSRKKTASAKTIQDIIRIIFPDELEYDTTRAATETLGKYHKLPKDNPVLSIKKIDAIFRIAMLDYNTDVRVGTNAIVYLAGVCEHVTGEILYEMEEITAQAIFERIKCNEGLSEVFHGYVINLDEKNTVPELGASEEIKRQTDEYIKHIK